jgi:hypothetical protein
MIVLAMMTDPDGIPRAWASAATKPEAEAEARRQLETYRAKKAINRDQLAHASFRVVFEVFDEAVA